MVVCRAHNFGHEVVVGTFRFLMDLCARAVPLLAVFVFILTRAHTMPSTHICICHVVEVWRYSSGTHGISVVVCRSMSNRSRIS